MMMPMATTLQKTICAVNSSTPKRKATTLANNAMMTQTTRTDRYTTICSKYLVFISLAYLGGEFGGEWIHICVWLSCYAVHLKLSQYY